MKFIKKLVFSSESIYFRILFILSSVIVIFILLMIFLDNPFSSYNHKKIIEITTEVSKPVKIYDKYKSDSDNVRYIFKEDYKIFKKNDRVLIIKIDRKNSDLCHVKKYNSKIHRVPLDLLLEPVKHPLPPLYVYNGNLLFFGTTKEANDYLSKIVYGGKNTLLLVFSSMVVFIFWGIIFGVVIGYFENIRPLHFVFNGLMKVIESTPLLLWIIFTVIFAQTFFAGYPNWKHRLIFGFIGFFSSPALGRLIADKIRLLRNEDFIIALQLLGISNRRIIFSHILRYYCFSDIFFQGAYISVQVIFFDFTLSVLKYGNPSTWGDFLYNLMLTVPRQPMQEGIFVVVLFSFIAFFFHLSRFFESQSQI